MIAIKHIRMMAIGVNKNILMIFPSIETFPGSPQISPSLFQTFIRLFIYVSSIFSSGYCSLKILAFYMWHFPHTFPVFIFFLHSIQVAIMIPREPLKIVRYIKSSLLFVSF